MIEADIHGCYEAIKKGSHSFYAASKLLPKPVRDPAVVLYAFCRVADDNVDSEDAPQDAIDLQNYISSITLTSAILSLP